MVVRLYHGAVVAYYVWLDYWHWHVVWDILTTFDELYQTTYNTAGLIYITVWTQIVQQLYFGLSLLDDLPHTVVPKSYQWKKSLGKFRSFLFTCLVFPLCVVCTVDYWSVYLLDPLLVEPRGVIGTLLPIWMCNLQHGGVALLCFVEACLERRLRCPPRRVAFCVVAITLLAYGTTATIFCATHGIWPYPFLGLLSGSQWAILFASNLSVGCASVLVCEELHHAIWGTQERVHCANKKLA